VRTTASAVSPGTEKLMTDLARMSLLGKARARPDLVRRVLDKARTEGWLEAYRQAMGRLDTPAPLGYSSAGSVLELGPGVEGFTVGQRVACAGSGHASHADLVRIPLNLCVPIPDGVSDEQAAFGMIAAIALHGLRTGGVELGQRVALIGLGLIGLIAVQMARAMGARVFGCDLQQARVDRATALGADLALLTADSMTLRQATGDLTGGGGFDCVVVMASTTSNEPVELATDLARERGRVVVVGAVPTNVDRNLFYEKELSLVVSRGPGAGIYDPVYEDLGVDYPEQHVRWTEARNIQAYLELVARGAVTVEPLITHRLPLEQALDAYGLLSGERKEPYLGIVLTYDQAAKAPATRTVSLKDRAQDVGPRQPVVGVIGGGLFATTTLLPALASVGGVRLKTIATTTGHSVEHVAGKFGFEQCTTDLAQVLDDPEISLVLVLTRHGSHASLGCECLRRGKHVFVEKPLALTLEELEQVTGAYREGGAQLMVGFNRRFAPLSAAAKSLVSGEAGAIVVNQVVNAGKVDPDSWVYDPQEGGGRVVGEVCHFVDLFQYFAGAPVADVYAQAAQPSAGANFDDLVVSLKAANGSVGSILYTAQGDKSVSREVVQVFAHGTVCTIDNFRSAVLVTGGRASRRRLMGTDRGHKAEMEALVAAVASGAPLPVTFDEYANSTLATLAAQRSLETGLPFRVRQDGLAPGPDLRGVE
jgi:predicted dehydrogenase/threonine dehydrogenase-like Zn-dependent dehydrogenase